MAVCANCGVAYTDGEAHVCGTTGWRTLWEAVKVLLMVCGALFIALVILVIGICSSAGPF